jgi:hypothetical protein
MGFYAKDRCKPTFISTLFDPNVLTSLRRVQLLAKDPM